MSAFRKKFALAIFLIVAPGCCPDYVEPIQVYGTYTVSHKYGSEVLELKLDGTYLHVFTDNKGRTTVNYNTWEFEHEQDKQMITLRKFNPNHHNNRVSQGFWIVEVEQSSGDCNPRLCLDPDLYINFEKSKY